MSSVIVSIYLAQTTQFHPKNIQYLMMSITVIIHSFTTSEMLMMGRKCSKRGMINLPLNYFEHNLFSFLYSSYTWIFYDIIACPHYCLYTTDSVPPHSLVLNLQLSLLCFIKYNNIIQVKKFGVGSVFFMFWKIWKSFMLTKAAFIWSQI